MKRIITALLACTLILIFTCTAFAADYDTDSYWSGISVNGVSLPNTSIVDRFNAKQKTDSANQRILFRFSATDSQNDKSKIGNFQITMKLYNSGGALLDTVSYSGSGTSSRSGFTSDCTFTSYNTADGNIFVVYVQLRNLTSAIASSMTKAVVSVRDCNGVTGSNTLTINFSPASLSSTTTKAVTTTTTKAATPTTGVAGGGATTSRGAAGNGNGGNAAIYGNENANLEENLAPIQTETYTTPDGQTHSRSIEPVMKKYDDKCKWTNIIATAIFVAIIGLIVLFSYKRFKIKAFIGELKKRRHCNK